MFKNKIEHELMELFMETTDQKIKKLQGKLKYASEKRKLLEQKKSEIEQKLAKENNLCNQADLVLIDADITNLNVAMSLYQDQLEKLLEQEQNQPQ